MSQQEGGFELGRVAIQHVVNRRFHTSMIISRRRKPRLELDQPRLPPAASSLYRSLGLGLSKSAVLALATVFPASTVASAKTANPKIKHRKCSFRGKPERIDINFFSKGKEIMVGCAIATHGDSGSVVPAGKGKGGVGNDLSGKYLETMNH